MRKSKGFLWEMFARKAVDFQVSLDRMERTKAIRFRASLFWPMGMETSGVLGAIFVS